MLFMLGIYANATSACGKISDLHMWWDQLSVIGPPNVYFPNASKTRYHALKFVLCMNKVLTVQVWVIAKDA